MAQIKNLKFNDNVLSKTNNIWLAEGGLARFKTTAQVGGLTVDTTTDISGGYIHADRVYTTDIRMNDWSGSFIIDDDDPYYVELNRYGLAFRGSYVQDRDEDLYLGRVGMTVQHPSHGETNVQYTGSGIRATCGNYTEIYGFKKVTAASGVFSSVYDLCATYEDDIGQPCVAVNINCGNFDLRHNMESINITADSGAVNFNVFNGVYVNDIMSNDATALGFDRNGIHFYGGAALCLDDNVGSEGCGLGTDVLMRYYNDASDNMSATTFNLVVSSGLVHDVNGYSSGYVVFAVPAN